MLVRAATAFVYFFRNLIIFSSLKISVYIANKDSDFMKKFPTYSCKFKINVSNNQYW